MPRKRVDALQSSGSASHGSSIREFRHTVEADLAEIDIELKNRESVMRQHEQGGDTGVAARLEQLRREEQRTVHRILDEIDESPRAVLRATGAHRPPRGNPVYVRVGFDATSYRYLPVLIAAVVALLISFVGLTSPGNFFSGLMASRSPILPQTHDASELLLKFANPINDDDIPANISNVDPKKFEELSTQDYVVQPGDSLNSIAKRYNLNIDSLISFNNITDPRRIQIGQHYKIPNRDGLQYTVAKGDTLETIAKKFSTNVISLLDGNGLDTESLKVGSRLFIPDVRMNPTDLKLLLGELFLWPVTGRITSNYGFRSDPFTGVRGFHNGIDIANYEGTPVRAALAGKVVMVDSSFGDFGKAIIIQHTRGYQTLYGHLSAFTVTVGQNVSQGQTIARVGTTGKSTGPHLHFSVYQYGALQNPLKYLK